MRVLLVEDHPAMRFAVRTLLELVEKMEVVGETGEANEALRLAEKDAPDVVVLDLGLEDGGSGVELCREIKALPDPPHVLVHTAHNSPDAVSSALLSGADGYVHKGIDHEELPRAVRRVLSGERVWLLGPESAEAERRLRKAPPASSLTPREGEVFALILRRLTNAEIARELSLSLPTVKTHVGNVLKKHGFRSRRELF